MCYNVVNHDKTVEESGTNVAMRERSYILMSLPNFVCRLLVSQP